MNEPTNDSIVNELIADLITRAKMGEAKYGTTLDRDDLALTQWLDHGEKEMMDGALYMKRAKRKHLAELNKRALIEQQLIGLSKLLKYDGQEGKARTLYLLAVALGTPQDCWTDDMRRVAGLKPKKGATDGEQPDV